MDFKALAALVVALITALAKQEWTTFGLVLLQILKLVVSAIPDPAVKAALHAQIVAGLAELDPAKPE